MKLKIFGTLFLFSALVCGGGIDSGSMVQFLFGAILGILSGGVVIYETNFKKVKRNNYCHNVHSRACYLPK